MIGTHVTVSEIAQSRREQKLSGCTPSTIRHHVRTKKLPYTDINGVWWISYEVAAELGYVPSDQLVAQSSPK